MKKKHFLYPLLIILLASPFVLAILTKEAPSCTNQAKRYWLTPLEVELRLAEKNLEMRALRISERRCYIVNAFEENRGLRNMIMHPVTGKLIKK